MSTESMESDNDSELHGPLRGIRVVELASEFGAFAGKLLAGLGADVVVVEPPGGHRMRTYGPFAEGTSTDTADSERSLWWWHYNTSKRGVIVDLDTSEGADALRQLVSRADIVLEGEPTTRLRELRLDHPQFRALDPKLIWVSVTAFGRTSPRADEPVTDLTLLAGAGPVWSCGYDDHTLPPVRGGGNQAMHQSGVFAAISALTAVIYRDATGEGQHIDVSAHAASNVTTESSSYEYLVAGRAVQRQTGRHAASTPTMDTQVLAADGKWVTTGFPPRQVSELKALVQWLTELGLNDDFDEFFFLEMGIERGGITISEIGENAEATAVFGASRAAMAMIASKLPAYDFFVGAQSRAIPVGIINSIEEILGDPHIIERGFPVPVHHEDLGRDVIYAGAPFKMSRTPWRITRRAPKLGEHQSEVLD